MPLVEENTYPLIRSQTMASRSAGARVSTAVSRTSSMAAALSIKPSSSSENAVVDGNGIEDVCERGTRCKRC